MQHSKFKFWKLIVHTTSLLHFILNIWPDIYDFHLLFLLYLHPLISSWKINSFQKLTFSEIWKSFFCQEIERTQNLKYSCSHNVIILTIDSTIQHNSVFTNSTAYWCAPNALWVLGLRWPSKGPPRGPPRALHGPPRAPPRTSLGYPQVL